ncbi:sulfurtransferase TusA family protein [Sphaerochaeta halotolerans]|jgi:TusA-related sulfurtransferase|uniref:Preprotein translocase subunit TatB n=1 Tax=Sphaerochaeta halotolerans TaxID=2293840 RepID=A0A372MEV9_9SPIR|nr:sulfurtransferase TusA family protein [Sphaerochaeta halotolerans]MBG0768059.1 sulfurtransferase TusA family protein [Spirochaetaceae bacterium]MDK2860118.1 tRNA 2-thiouridine synthesizing protein [Sphaerochaeta sp.]MDN5334772.1 tRNA 2-thiouridine synthesizing protein [Sphaerochaeta sp.]MXI85907.1 preprotein translocase subunit TatB [Sphaerochaeta halotolerans]RFU94317.1 preprotein translocase subunit TatB [Sphaerochaeta halotolerans]
MEIDARGLSCPQPVIETKKAVDKKIMHLKVLVDTIAAKENVSRFAKVMKYHVDVVETDYGWMLELEK